MFVNDEPPPTATRIVVARFRATTRIALLSALAERVFFRHRGPALQLRPPVVSRLSGFSSGGHGRLHQLVEHVVQVSRRDLDVGVLSLRGPHLRGDDSAPIRVLEVAVGKLVPGLVVLGVLVVDTQIPPPVLTKSMLLDELVLLLGGRLVLAPVVPDVEIDVARRSVSSRIRRIARSASPPFYFLTFCAAAPEMTRHRPPKCGALSGRNSGANPRLTAWR